MSKILTWEEVINSDLEYIQLFGYGSLINHFSHDYDIAKLEKGRIFSYKRVFNINHPIEMFEERDDRYQMVSKLLNENYIKKINRLSLNNRGGLNVIQSDKKRDYINGLILTIPRKDFEEIAKRESIYKVHFEVIDILDKRNNVSKRIEGCILVSDESIIEKNVIPFYLYYKSCRSGAYLVNKHFGKEFDSTTFMSDNKTLAIDWVKEHHFKIGSKVEIISINYTYLINKKSKWHLTKNFNNVGTVIGYKKNLIVVEIDNKIKIPFDFLDLSPILHKKI